MKNEFFYSLNVVLTAPAAVPEPGAALMLLAGIGIMGGIARRRIGA